MRKVVLIDDDLLIHELWKMQAKAMGVEIACFREIDEFLRQIEIFPKDIPIYVDSNLENGVKGEVEVHRLKDAGFNQLYITTGHNKEDIDAPAFVLDVVGKRPAF